MARPSDPRLLVLHGLRLKGFAMPDVVAELVALDTSVVERELDALRDDGHVQLREGRLTGWALTPQGRKEHESLLAAELDEAGARGVVAAAYERFLALNQALLSVCTRWQLRDVDGASTVNDHTDAGHDAAVLADLGALHEQVLPICADLAAALDRYACYAARLGEALARLRAGELDYFTKPIIASYHTVWFELHEDLLATLGIERSSEAVG